MREQGGNTMMRLNGGSKLLGLYQQNDQSISIQLKSNNVHSIRTFAVSMLRVRVGFAFRFIRLGYIFT